MVLRPIPPPSREALRWAAVALAEAGRLLARGDPCAPLRFVAGAHVSRRIQLLAADRAPAHHSVSAKRGVSAKASPTQSEVGVGRAATVRSPSTGEAHSTRERASTRANNPVGEYVGQRWK